MPPSTLPAAPGVTVPPLPAISPTPGIVLHGYVRLANGSGLANVSICRDFASYPGVLIATTDSSGYFQSNFTFIPGDEMIGVWAIQPGYTFAPPAYRWRHYYGLEDRGLDFRATPSTATEMPPAPCS